MILVNIFCILEQLICMEHPMNGKHEHKIEKAIHFKVVDDSEFL